MTKGKQISLPFVDIKNAILGKNYELSILFATPDFAQKLNKEYRKKSYTPNVLSFPYSKNSGEIVLSLKVIRESASDYDYTYHDFIGYLLIHGCLHLKGMEHGGIMESEEEKYKKKFKIYSKSKSSLSLKK